MVYAPECDDDRGRDLRPGEHCFDGEGPDGGPKWMRFHCPRRDMECQVALSPQRNANGATWQWDGNREQPTLQPSINCNGGAGCGWHGWMRQGVLSDA